MADGREHVPEKLTITPMFDTPHGREAAQRAAAQYGLEYAPPVPKEQSITASVTGDVVTIRKGSWGRHFGIAMLWGLPDVSDPFAGITEHARVSAACDAKLDGLQASVDALAKRLGGKAGEDDGESFKVAVIDVNVVTKDHAGLVDRWVVRNLKEVKPGVVLRDGRERVFVHDVEWRSEGENRMCVKVKYMNGEKA